MSWISALTCVVIPLLIVLLIRRALTEHRERKLLREQHPNEQWLWRRDWASRTANDQASSYSAPIWLLAFFWNLISLPVLFIWRDRRGDPFLWIFVLFPIAGVILIVVAAYQTLRRRKYGVSVCRFDTLPIAVGRTLHGEVETRVGDVPTDGFTGAPVPTRCSSCQRIFSCTDVLLPLLVTMRRRQVSRTRRCLPGNRRRRSASRRTRSASGCRRASPTGSSTSPSWCCGSARWR